MNIEKEEQTQNDYNPLQMPANIETAEIHGRACQIGRNQTKNSIKTCPCCFKPSKKTYGIFNRGIKITKFGSTIPCYFHFTRFILGYFIITTIGNISYALKIMKINYNFLVSRGYKPRKSLTLSFIMTNEFMNSQRKKLDEIKIENIPIELVTNILIILYSFYFLFSQRRMHHRIKGGRKISAADYTVMIGNVKEEDNNMEIERFVKEELEKKNLPMVNIQEISKASFKGNLMILKQSIDEKVEEIDAIKKTLKENEERILKGGRKIAEKLIKEKEEEINKNESKKLKILKKELNMEQHMNNCIVFLTLETVEEKNRLLSCKAPSGLFSWFKKKNGFEISEAPHPSIVSWEKIGYPKTERTKKATQGIAFIILSFPIFALTIMYLEFFRENFVRKNKGLYFYEQILGTTFMPTVVTVLTGLYIKILNFLSKYSKYINVNKYLLRSTRRLILIQILGYAVSQAVYIIFEKKDYIDHHDSSKVEEVRLNSLQIFKIETYDYFLSKIFILPISTLFNMDYFLLIFKRWRIKRALQKNHFFSTKYHFKTQKEINKLFEKPESKIDSMYYRLTTCSLIIIASCQFVPPLPLFGYVFLFLQSFVDKFQFFKFTKEPIPDSYLLAKKMGRVFIVWIPRIFTFSRILRFYFYESVRGKLSIWIYIVDALLVLIVFFPVQRVFENYLEKKDLKFNQEMEIKRAQGLKESLLGEEEEDLLFKNAKFMKYGEVKKFLDCDYERMNPMTRARAESDWRGAHISVTLEEEEDDDFVNL